jgi:hypothetical protein
MNTAVTSPDVDLCRAFAAIYRERGFNPLPSRTDDKRPMIRFRDMWDGPALTAEQFERHVTTNIQVMTGRAWRLLAIDLDGEGGKDWWRDKTGTGAWPRTWITHSGGNGMHLWFSLPPGWVEPLPKAFLWRSEAKHEAVERLCDQSLVMAPPSIHPKTGNRYRFLDREHSPMRLNLPGPCPAWILRHPVIQIRREEVAAAQPARSAPAIRVEGNRSQYRRLDVLAAIPDKLALARQWGVRFAGGASERGWAPCHAINRPDAVASAAVNIHTGSYVDLGSATRMGFFDLAVMLGVYVDYRSAAVAA